jgi:DNA polymerase-3 subunit gamma/tau
MSYLVLARKYRPQVFDEVIGQDHITGLLSKAVESDRATHAYLFCGPRGIGKTSCARILAKSLNCEKGPTLKPCGTCTACREIAEGRSFDVLEIDGASNRGIDEIRALRENVKFAPGYGHYKIYIVDEVHMLTPEAFNALLKTLEEPPPHVKFIFATTAPNKVPATIISRCQRFDFKRITLKTIVETLQAICEKEKLTVAEDALYTIAKAADGGMRDALSVLDQLCAVSGERVGAGDVFSMLGIVETQLLFEMADALSRKDCAGALDALEKVIDKGKDVKQLTKDLIEHFRNLMIIKVGGKSLGRLVDYPVSVKEIFLSQAGNFTLKEILAAIDVLIAAQETARITEFLRMPLEVAFAKLTYQGESAVQVPLQMIKREGGAPQAAAPRGPQTLKAPSPQLPQGPAPAQAPREERGIDADGVEEEGPQPPQGPQGPTDIPAREVLDVERIRRCWDTLTFAVSRERMSIATYLQEGIPVSFDGKKLIIGFPSKSRFHKEALEGEANVKLVENIFSQKLEMPVLVAYEISDDCAPKEEDSAVAETLKAFKGKVTSRWHND